MNYKIFMVLLCAPLLTYAQKPVSLEDAIGMARNQSPRLKIAESNIRQAQASKGESWEIAPTSANFSWGQINSDDKHDKQVAVEQNFGSLLTPYYKNALVKNRVRTGEYYRQLVEREVTAEVIGLLRGRRMCGSRRQCATRRRNRGSWFSAGL